jgi:hypothetical protein
MRAIHTWFPYGSIRQGLSQAAYINSLAHSSIGTPSPSTTFASHDVLPQFGYDYRHNKTSAHTSLAKVVLGSDSL